jgi:hypothetical protein
MAFLSGSMPATLAHLVPVRTQKGEHWLALLRGLSPEDRGGLR